MVSRPAHVASCASRLHNTTYSRRRELSWPALRAGYTDAVDDGLDPGIARAGAAVAARRVELGISQRELARQGVITAPALIAFEKGRSWPRERTRHTLEGLLQWPAGTIARLRSGAGLSDVASAGVDDHDDVPLVVDAVELALARLDDAIAELPAPEAADFGERAAALLVDLRKLESVAARAVRPSHGSPAVMKALGTVRRRYNELMLRAAETPSATAGQRLYAARRRANLSTAEAAAALGATAEVVEAVEAGGPVDQAMGGRIDALIAGLGG
jgi:transcriptional regulator with XRE-family HTH domain